jgi:hypothetical protein
MAMNDEGARVRNSFDLQRDLVNLVGLVPCAFVDAADCFLARSLGQTEHFTVVGSPQACRKPTPSLV